MYTLNYTSAIKKMTIHELGDFIFENYYKQIGYAKESDCYSMKRYSMKCYSMKRFVAACSEINRKNSLF